MTRPPVIEPCQDPGPQPGLLDEPFARLLRCRKSQFVSAPDQQLDTSDEKAVAPGGSQSGPSWEIRQTGGAYLDGRFDIPPVAWELSGSEPVIETFVVELDGSCKGTGQNQALIEAWLPAVRAMAARLLPALVDAGVVLRRPAYLTVSLTPDGHVIDTPHLDDDQYHPDDGVGLAAIASTGRGTVLNRTPVPCRPVRPGVPIEIEPHQLERFATARAEGDQVQQASAGRIVVFPQFGQLHSGPPPGSQELSLAGDCDVWPRRLMVFRAQTEPEPTSAGAGGSGPT